jgi:hypothetical protein
LDESAQVTGGAVLDAENGVQIIVVLDDHAGAKLGGGDSHCWVSLLNKNDYDCDAIGGRRAGHIFRWTRGSNSLFYTGLGSFGNSTQTVTGVTQKESSEPQRDS